MISIEQTRKAALSLPGTEEKPHFHLTSFRVKNKIFATIHADKNYVMVKLSAIDQSVFCAFDKEIIFPVPNKWGKQGWTLVNLRKVRKDILKDALTTAYQTVLSKK